MYGKRRAPWSLVALIGILAACANPGPVGAGVILAVSTDRPPGGGADPAYGVLACLGGPCVYAPATENPARAINGGVEATLAQNGSSIRFDFNLGDTSGQQQYASTAFDPTFPESLLITILGTGGEPAGTPVSLTLFSGIANPGSAMEITNFLQPDPSGPGGTQYDPNTDTIINGVFTIGDTFGYWASVAAAGNTHLTFQVDLSVQVQQPGNAEPVPVPGTLALLVPAGAAFGLLFRRRLGRA
jgi:hypothetical protein